MIGKKNDAADENTIVGCTILVDAFFFFTYLKESHSSLIELAIASGFAKDEEDCKANIRVITEREEQLLPILEQKLGKNLPLKSFYVHGRLYERYLHIMLNQVVIEGLLPDQNSKNIVIKSKVIPMPYLLDMICNNLWDAAQNYNCVVLDANCKHHNENHASLQEFSLTELEGLKSKFFYYAKKLFFTDLISESDGISIPTSNACGCQLYFGSEDIFDLGIIPAIKYTVSVVTGAITNEDIFGMYGIEHFFVVFDYFSSVFHRSYQEFFEYNLKKLIDIDLEKKRLKIPYTVFPEPIGGLLQPVVNKSCILADSFLYGNALQVFGETYSLSLQHCIMYNKVFEAGKYRLLEKKGTMVIAEKGEIISRTGIIKKALYVRSNTFYNTKAVINKRGSDNSIDIAPEQPTGLDEYIVDKWTIKSSGRPLDKRSYTPLYITVKYLNHSSSVMISAVMGTGFEYDHHYNKTSSLMERLVIINTQSK